MVSAVVPSLNMIKRPARLPETLHRNASTSGGMMVGMSQFHKRAGSATQPLAENNDKNLASGGRRFRAGTPGART
jgi:hypothetical protein